MDFSELTDAILQNDKPRTNRLMQEIQPRLIKFLRIHMNANPTEAEDCAQDALLVTLGKIREKKIRNPEKVLSYLFTVCRNTFLKMKQRKREVNYEQVPVHSFHEPSQLDSLMDQEKRSILEWCLNQLKKEYQRFIAYWLKHPDTDARVVANLFNISLNNTWTRKHRIIRMLNECYERKSSL